MGNSTFDSLYNSFDTTNLTISHNPAHTASVDVYYHYGVVPDPPTGGQAVGRASCQDWSGHRCNHWHVIYDGEQIVWFSDDELKNLACHETGHTVGLMHPEIAPHGLDPTDNTVFGCQAQDDFDEPYLRSHNVGHINGEY